MLRSLLLCAVVSASALGCASTQSQHGSPFAAAAATADCVRLETASRIPQKPGTCSAVPGRSYSQADVERTGQFNVGDALQMLDPSITVHH
jgi:hypothetical protein